MVFRHQLHLILALTWGRWRRGWCWLGSRLGCTQSGRRRRLSSWRGGGGRGRRREGGRRAQVWTESRPWKKSPQQLSSCSPPRLWSCWPEVATERGRGGRCSDSWSRRLRHLWKNYIQCHVCSTIAMSVEHQHMFRGGHFQTFGFASLDLSDPELQRKSLLTTHNSYPVRCISINIICRYKIKFNTWSWFIYASWKTFAVVLPVVDIWLVCSWTTPARLTITKLLRRGNWKVLESGRSLIL